ncbi:MAG: flagellar protein export ATPase FliI [Alphaproteobacteria bacterium]
MAQHEDNTLTNAFKTVSSHLEQMNDYTIFGRVKTVLGMMIEIDGLSQHLAIGDHCRLLPPKKKPVVCEIVGFREERALAMPFGSLEGISMGCRAELTATGSNVFPDDRWLGRVINSFAEPIDHKGVLKQGKTPYLLRNSPPPSHHRSRVEGKLDLGVRSINTFLTCCKGQRMGIFSGSGVGKSTLMAMMSKYTKSDVIVIGLIGERGREVKEFIEDNLGEEGLKRSVVVVATSDEPPLMRRQAAYLTLSVAEYFRDQGKDVLCLMDSVTRFAMAQREIGLSVGEPPASKGYTPTVFSELPKLLERAGPGTTGSGGSITGLFTVLVEGDDHNEPISDAVRGILDGHIVLERSIGERGRFPAVNVLRSVSRTLPDCNNAFENQLVLKARELLSNYEDMAEMIRLGAYSEGSNVKVDEAIHYYPALEAFLSQTKETNISFEEGYTALAEILNIPPPKNQNKAA